MKDYIERLRAKSEDTRKKIAIGTAAAVTAVVAIGWVIALLATGSLSIAATPVPEGAGMTLEESQRRFSQMAGAASAFYGSEGEEAPIIIIEDDTSSTLAPTETDPKDGTVIPF